MSDMLKLMNDSSIFTIEKFADSRFEISEACDGWYTQELTRAQVVALACELLELAGVAVPDSIKEGCNEQMGKG